MNPSIKIFIGYDDSEAIAYHTLCQSIINTTKNSVHITPIALKMIPEFTRKRSMDESTEFSFSRFLTPYLSGFEGWSLYMDCDFLIQEDLTKLWELRDEDKAIMVCKHDYKPSKNIKFNNFKQAVYEKKNWSSLMLFNNEKCRNLTLEVVNCASGMYLHQFQWLDQAHIGELPLNWNFLVGEENQHTPAFGIHFTNGGPWHRGVLPKGEYEKLWVNTLPRITEEND